jgi:hypothetical protein
MTIREGHTGKKIVVKTVISTGTIPRKIKIERWIAMCYTRAFLHPKTIDTDVEFQLVLRRNKGGCSLKDLSASDEAAVRELVLAKNVEARTLSP